MSPYGGLMNAMSYGPSQWQPWSAPWQQWQQPSPYAFGGYGMGGGYGGYGMPSFGGWGEAPEAPQSYGMQAQPQNESNWGPSPSQSSGPIAPAAPSMWYGSRIGAQNVNGAATPGVPGMFGGML
jgi:hypothetical protein